MPIILDLIVLLTVFAVTLFYTAIGNSAPNEDTSRVVMFEVSSVLQDGEARGDPGNIAFRAWLTLEGVAVASGEVLPLSRTADGTQRFLVRNAPEEAKINFAARAVDLGAFDATGWSIAMSRTFPGGETVVRQTPAGRLSALSMEVWP